MERPRAKRVGVWHWELLLFPDHLWRIQCVDIVLLSRPCLDLRLWWICICYNAASSFQQGKSREPLPVRSVLFCLQFFGNTIPNRAKLKDPFVATKFSLEPHGDSIIGLINDTAHLWRSVLYFTDSSFSLKVRSSFWFSFFKLIAPKFAFAVWVLSVIGKLFSGLTLLYMSTSYFIIIIVFK